MKALLLKDVYTLKSYAFTIIIFVLAFGSIGILQENYFSFLPLMFMLFGMMSVLATFSYDEYAKWEKFALSLPITKKEMVISKYVLFLIAMLIGSILGFIATIVANMIKNTPVNITETIITLLAEIGAFMIITSFQYPFVYKYGAQKGRFAMFFIAIIVAILAGGVGFLLNAYPNLLNTIHPIINQFGAVIAVVIILALFYLSYRISYKIFLRKEF